MRVLPSHSFSRWPRAALVGAAALSWLTIGWQTARGEDAEEAHELPNFITVLYHFLVGTSFGEFIHKWENVIFSLLIAGFIILVARLASRNPQLRPGKLQNIVELVVEELEKFIVGVLGPRGRKFVPFLGTLFLYILCMNYFGLIPLMKAPTSNLNQTAALAICVFLFVQYTGIKENGIKGYFFHMLGEPRSGVQYGLAPLMFVLHVLEELIKPLSLSFRLFGNITGEDILIFIFVGLGVALTSFAHLPVGVPLQIPFYFLALLTGFIQALVFMLLSTIYFAMMLPHEDGEHH
jgi:F-type H+-transporting ATPase subunit a